MRLFIYLWDYINEHDNKLVIEEFSTYIKNVLSKSRKNSDIMLYKYIKSVNIAKSWWLILS